MVTPIIDIALHWGKAVADTEAKGGMAIGPLEAALIPTLPLQKSVESKAGKRDFKNT